MTHLRTQILRVLFAAAVALAVQPLPAAATSAPPVEDAYRAVSQARVLDGRAAAMVASEVEPVLVAIGDADGRELVERLRTARSAEEREAARKDLEAHLRTLAAIGAHREAGALTHDRALLERIMAEEGVSDGAAAQEFLRRIQEQVLGWLERVISRWFGSDAASAGLEAVYYVALAASSLVAAWLVWRLLSALLGRAPARRAAGPWHDGGQAEPVVDAARGLPADALAYADAEAGAGRFREAVRALFGGAARLLVERGVIPATRTRTTAEILGDVLERGSAAHAPLAALAALFEPAWYGHADPGPDGFAAARAAYLEVDAAAAAVAGDRA